jgi:multidrug efflux system membrane fusion protein
MSGDSNPRPLAAPARKGKTRLVLFAAGVAVVAALLWFRAPGKPAAGDTARAAAAPRAVAVDVARAAYDDVPVYLEGIGTVQATYTVTVTPRVDGELQKVAFTEGQAVKKGDLLAQIDPRPYQAAYDLAVATKAKDEAQLANAQRDLKRYQTLAPGDYTSRQTLETQEALIAQLQAQIRGDQANIDSARTQLGYTTLVSPIDGRTGMRLVDPGNNVHSTDATGVVVVTQVQPITAVFTLPEDQLPLVEQAMQAGGVAVTALSRDGRTELDRGSLVLIDNQIDQTTGTIKLKASFPNARNTLWPGQFINARLLQKTRHHALTVPSAAVQRGPDGPFAYVLKDDGTVEARPLTIGGETGDRTVVDAGLKQGEQVVTSNQYRLQPGAAVRVSGQGNAAAHGDGSP